jgi:hypothetical protein
MSSLRAVARGRARLLSVAIAIAGVLLLSACGSGQTFSASEFVDKVKQEGVTIHLGEKLPSGGQNDTVYAVNLPPLPGEPKPPPGTIGGGGSSGSLYVYGDTGGADDEVTACRASGLLCYQAANVVVMLEANGLEAQRLAVAIRKLASD